MPRNFVQDANGPHSKTCPMQFSHHPDIWSRFPELAASTLFVRGIHAGANVDAPIERFHAIARERLAAVASESELPEVNAWRRVFSRMGLKPTQYRCASESLLRRFRKEGTLPRIHPLIDVCNAASIAFGIPVAALDIARIAWPLQVKPALGNEHYVGIGGEEEPPDAGEVSFIDAQGEAHARRWTHRQSGHSAVRGETSAVLIVMEAVHATAREDVARLAGALAEAIGSGWNATVEPGRLSSGAATFTFN
jgi:DNA/RNA-binding domain of Phe-tRNA-synthetase-like protein